MPSPNRRSSTSVSSSAFAAAIVVLMVLLLATATALILLIRTNGRLRSQQSTISPHRTARTPSPPPFGHDSRVTAPPVSAPSVPPLPQRPPARPLRPATSFSSPQPSPPHPSYPLNRPPTPSTRAVIRRDLTVSHSTPAARTALLTRRVAEPTTIDTTDMSSDDITALGERGVVNQGFAEMLARRAVEETDFAVLLGSEEGSTVGGNGEDEDERRKNSTVASGRKNRDGNRRVSCDGLNERTGGRSRSVTVDSEGKGRVRAWRRPDGVSAENSNDRGKVFQLQTSQTSTVRKVSTFPQ